MTIQRGTFTHRGLRLSYLDSAPGDATRPVVLLLHGFPDCAEMWTAQIDALHVAGYRCVAPDTVGCGESEVAARVSDYKARRIISDFQALLKHLGIERADVVGHDWGAVLAWLFAGWYPESTRRLLAMSVGHPMAYARAGIDQKLAAWYIAFFMLAGLSERLLLGSGRFSLGRVFGHPRNDEVMKRMSQPGRMTAALRIYRANLIDVLFRRHPRVSAPTLALWSTGDRFLVRSQVENSERYVDGDWHCEIVEGGHWIPLEHPDWLNRRMLEHFGAPSATDARARA